MGKNSDNPTAKSLVLTHLELLFVVAIWAGTFIATKIVLEQIPPVLSALYRYVIASLILLAVNRRGMEKIDRSDYPQMVFLSLTGVTLYYLLQHYGINYTNATDASILISLSPVFIGLISWLLLKEPIKPVTILGLTTAFVGSLLVITNGSFTWGQAGPRFWGDILILLTAVSWAFYSVYGKKLLGRYRTSTLITCTTVIGTLFLIPFSIPELLHTTIQCPTWFVWLNLLYLGGAASVYGYLAWYRALERLPAVTVGSYLYFRPLLTGVIAALVLVKGWACSWSWAGVLIIVGAYLSSK